MTLRRRLLFVPAMGAALGMLLAIHGGGAASFDRGVIDVKLPQFRGEDAAWPPDGRWIAIPDRAGIRLRNVETGVRRQIQAPPLRGFNSPVRLSWSPDGRTLRYVTTAGPMRKRGFWVTTIRRDGSSLRQVPLGMRASATTWARQGWPLAFATGPYAYDIEKGPLGPEPAIWTLPSMNGKPKRIVSGGKQFLEPAFSPTGIRILFIRSDRHGVGVWIVNADGSAPRLLAGRLRASYAAWSPDGKQVALAATTWKGDLRQHLYTVSAAGGRLHRISAEEVQSAPVWSPDGRWIVYANYEGEIKMIHPNGSGESVIASLPGEEIRGLLWSPDGRHLAYTARPFPTSD